MSQSRKIITDNIRPPIPTRAFDWIAYYDGKEDGVKGFGPTEEEAIKDLEDNVEPPTDEQP